MHAKRLVVIIALVLAGVALMAFSAQATAYTWTGTSSSAWNQTGNWNVSGFPNAYTDTATIPYLTLRPTVSLSTAASLGGASTALAISNKATTGTVNALDITSSGILGMQGGISIGTRRTLTIEGILRNDAASSATTYNLTGTAILNGGTLSSLNNGIWNLGSGINGYGTISAPITFSAGTVSANVANQTLHITGNVVDNVARGLGGGSTYVSGALLSIEGGNISGTGGITNYNLVNLRGNFNGITLYNDAAYSVPNFGGWNYFNLTGDSSWNNGSLNIMNFNGHKLDVTGSVVNFASVDKGVNVGSGTLNNPGAAATTISNGNTMTFAGGSITSTGGGAFNFATNLRGYANISAPVNIQSNGSMLVSGGTTTITAPLNNIGGATIAIASDGKIHITGTTANWGNFINNGVLISDPSTQTFGDLTVAPAAYIQAAAGDKYQVKGNFINNSTQNTSWNTTAATLAFLTNGTSTVHSLALAGADKFGNNSGYTDNFAWDTLDLTGQTLTLSDGDTANFGTALYVRKILGLVISGDTVTDITGTDHTNIYYDPYQNPDLHDLTYKLEGTGRLMPTPVPPGFLLLGSGLLGMGLLGRKWRAQQS